MTWFKAYNTVLDWKFPFPNWFVGGQLNASLKCLPTPSSWRSSSAAPWRMRGTRSD